MIPNGMGFVVIHYTNENLRLISELPTDVQLLRMIPALPWDEWVHGGHAELHSFYLLISHRFCPRLSRGMRYCTVEHDAYMREYEQCDRIERLPLEMPPQPYLNWRGREVSHRNEAGELHTYRYDADLNAWLDLATGETYKPPA